MLVYHRSTWRLWITGLGLLALAAGTFAAEPQDQVPPADSPKLAAPITEGQRVFTCGHSFHVWVPGIVADLCKKAEIPGHVQLGVSSIGGSRVIQHWDIAPENKAKDALQTGNVDVLTLSPIFLSDAGIENFTTLALEHNQVIRVIVQPIWLRWDIYEPTTKRPAKVDHNAITGEELRKRHAEHFQKMDEHIRELNKKYGRTVLYVAPAPQALIALREKIIAGQAPGLKVQEDLFTDELGHGKPPLMALVAYVNYATIYRRSPVGLPVPEILKQAKLGDQEEDLNRLLQELAWEAVIQHPLSGVQAATADKQAQAEPRRDAGTALKAAVAYLSKQQKDDGSWKIDAGNFNDGVSALCTLALLNGGVEVQDERSQQALTWLRGQQPAGTYARALQTLVFCRAGVPEDQERIRRNVDWLIEAQVKDGENQGGWSYVLAPGSRADGSCTRFAMWALDAARRADAKMPESVWRSNAEYWLTSQLEDGGWAYTRGASAPTATMTLAGISCLSMVQDAVADPALGTRIGKAVERAWKRQAQWHDNPQPSYLKSHGFRYYAFQVLGQAATHSGRDKIGEVAWKAPATQLVLSEQQADTGRWNDASFGGSQPLIGTGLAILFLTEK